jgi:putative salt-induced outer membrane protein YdiY
MILAAALAAALSASADKVTMKSGTVLTGTAGEIRDGFLMFASEDFGDMALKVESVASLESEKTFAEGEMPFDVTAPAPEVVETEEEEDHAWHGSINVAYMSSRGNTYNNNASVLFNINRRWEEDRVKGDLGYYYSKTGTSKATRETTSNRFEGEGQHDHFWAEKIYTYENARYDSDKIAGLNYRLRLGAGLGYQWLDGYECEHTGKWSFSQEAGFAWVRTGYKLKDPDAEESYCSFRYAHHLTYNPKWNENVEGFHNLEYMPDIADWEVYLMKADIGFTTKILMDFDLLCKIEWEYNSTPSAGRKSSDTRYIVGLGYKW